MNCQNLQKKTEMIFSSSIFEINEKIFNKKRFPALPENLKKQSKFRKNYKLEKKQKNIKNEI